MNHDPDGQIEGCSFSQSLADIRIIAHGIIS